MSCSLMKCRTIAGDCVRGGLLLFLPLAKEGGREIRRGYGQITQGGLSRGGQVGVLDDTIATCCANHNALPGFHVMPKTPTDPSLASSAEFTTFSFLPSSLSFLAII